MASNETTTTFLDMAKERWSVRKFTDEQISPEHMERILEAGRHAPSACNYQPQRVLVLQSPAAIAKIRSLTHWAFNAPTVLLVCADLAESWKNVDGCDSAEIDATIALDRVNKGYHASDIVEQCGKLSEAGIEFWMTFLNGVAGAEHSHEHAVHSAEVFSACKPSVVGTGGLVLFPGTPLLQQANRGEFDPLTEKQMLEELKAFVEHLTCDCSFITHHTVDRKSVV